MYVSDVLGVGGAQGEKIRDKPKPPWKLGVWSTKTGEINQLGGHHLIFWGNWRSLGKRGGCRAFQGFKKKENVRDKKNNMKDHTEKEKNWVANFKGL